MPQVHVFNIPVWSKHLIDVDGTHFSASVYELQDGSVGVYVLIRAAATDEDLQREQMNSRIREATRSATGGKVPSFYVTEHQ